MHVSALFTSAAAAATTLQECDASLCAVIDAFSLE
jgi:hypothetical protein